MSGPGLGPAPRAGYLNPSVTPSVVTDPLSGCGCMLNGPTLSTVPVTVAPTCVASISIDPPSGSCASLTPVNEIRGEVVVPPAARRTAAAHIAAVRVRRAAAPALRRHRALALASCRTGAMATSQHRWDHRWDICRARQ